MTAPVSILIPAFRAEAHIARAVGSLLAQTMRDFEAIIISDDGQDYRSILQAQGIADPRLRFAGTGGMGKGVSCARNAGLDAATGNIIALLDADDRFYPAKLERMLPFALQYGFCACAFDCVRYEESGRQKIAAIGTAAADGPLTPGAYLAVHYSTNAMPVFDRRKMPARWREDLMVMEDLVFSMTAFEHLPAIYHVSEPLHEYIHTKNSLSTAPEAPARFIAAKKRIVEKLDDGTLGITQPESVTAFRRFVALSLETERDYAAAMQRGDGVTFTELLEKKLFS